MSIVAQATDELRNRTTRQEVAEWAMLHRMATATAAYTNATGANDYVALLDMMVYAHLKRRALEEHWIPTVLREEGTPVLEAYRRGEQDVWARGAKVLTEPQLEELRRVIEEWRAANPTQFYVSHVRFTDFANAMRVTADSARARVPSSVFGLLYIDPLAGLDPVARELQQYRALTERMMFLVNRLPIVLAWQVDLSVYHATNTPQVVRFIDNTSKFVENTARFADNTGRFADSTKRFAEAVVKFPADLTVERKAAVEQIDAATTRQVKSALDQTFAGVAEQRQAVVRDLEAQESRIRAVLADVRGVVERADEAGRSLNAATGQTIDNAEQSTRLTLNHAFLLAVCLVATALILLLLYRMSLKRWAPADKPA
jgi:hypothetical protein